MSNSPPERLMSWLARPRVHRAIIALSLLLMAPCLLTPLVLDDYVLAAKAAPSTTVAGLPRDPLWLFTFTTGDPQRNHALMDEGVLLPWWSDPHHLNAFFRPIASLTHDLDFWLWPHSAWLMHLQSLLWYGALLWVLAQVYRSVDGSSAAVSALALLLYAIDDAHGATVGWIANRNAVMSACLALPALALHHGWVARGAARAAWAAPACVVLGLCAGETAMCVIGYLAAYALVLDARPLAQRVVSLAPYLAIFVAHRLLYHALGLGSYGSAAYHDPVREPWAFTQMLAYNLPVLLSAELWVPVADFAFWMDAGARSVLFAWCAASLVLLGWLLAPLLRADRRARFWALGMLLAAVPVSASLPGERLLLAVGFGGAPLLARLMAAVWRAPNEHSYSRKLASACLFVLHLVAAPLMLPVRVCGYEPVRRVSDRLDASLPATEDVRDRTAIVLNAPFVIMVSYLQVARAVRAVPRPAHLYWLTSSSSETTVSRLDSRTLRVEQARGFLARPEETHYRADASALCPGGVVKLSAVRARVVSCTAEASPRPKRVDFQFDEPLESPRYVFRTYGNGSLAVWSPLAVGASVRLPAQGFFDIVRREMLGVLF